jgi:hypothetical protein
MKNYKYRLGWQTHLKIHTYICVSYPSYQDSINIQHIFFYIDMYYTYTPLIIVILSVHFTTLKFADENTMKQFSTKGIHTPGSIFSIQHENALTL